MKRGSIIMIERPNKSPCNENTRDSLLPRNFMCNNQSERSWQQFFGTQKMICFWNSCHTWQSLPETSTPMLPQWGLYTRISNRNTVKSCRLVLLLHDNAPAHKSHTSQAAIRKCDLQSRPGSQWILSLQKPSKISAWAMISQWKCSQGSCNRVLWHPRCLLFSKGIRSLEATWTKCVIIKGNYNEK